MSERYTRKDAEQSFRKLCAALGIHIATSYNDVGGWSLDCAYCYGGFVINRVTNAGGGIDGPLGYRRRNAREFCEYVNAILDGLEFIEPDGQRQKLAAFWKAEHVA